MNIAPKPALTLRTARLELVASTLEHIVAELSAPASLATMLSAEVPDSWPPGEYDRDAVFYFKSRLEEDPTAVGWYGWYVIEVDSRGNRERLVAAAGYLGPPSAGVVEIGYSVVPEARGRGYATEVVRALLERALGNSAVQCVCAHTSSSNAVSASVLSRCGFALVGPGATPDSQRYEHHRSAATELVVRPANMARDIDDIIEQLQRAIPDVQIRQLQVTHPADDNGLWFITVPGKLGEVQIESSFGVCPFLIESSYNDTRHTGATVDDVVTIVRAILA